MKRCRQILSIILTLSLLLAVVPAVGAVPAGEITTAYYGIDRENGLVGKVTPGTTPESLLQQFVNNGTLQLTDGVKTGSVLQLASEGGISDQLTLVVQGDCNGDGVFSITDMLMVKALLLGQQEFSGASAQAADVSGDSSVTITDFLQMKSKILQLSDFPWGALSGTTLPDCRIMQVGDTLSFGPVAPDDAAPDAAENAAPDAAEDAAPDATEGTEPAVTPEEPAETTDPVPVTVMGDAVSWENGTVTALAEGSALVTWQETSLLIVVTPQPQSVSFQEEALVMSPGATNRPAVSLAYNLKTPVTFRSSDEAIATVDAAGAVTAVAEGKATITATLENGSSDTLAVQVLPLLSSITLNESAIKLKPGMTKNLTAIRKPSHSTEPLIWSSSNPDIATVSQEGAVTGVKNGTVTITCTSQYSKVSASCKVKVCNLIQVALTFDDGPSSAYTGKVLDLLKKYDIDATFFLVGNRIAGCENLLKRFVNEGHEIGYHTWAHKYLFQMSVSEMKNDYEKFQQAVKKACGGQATVYRAPGGGINNTALKNIPLPHIMWSVDTRDWESRDPYKVQQQILRGLKDGAIILLHDIHGTTYTGTAAALDYIFANDLDVEFMTVTELLSRKGKAPAAGATYNSG